MDDVAVTNLVDKSKPEYKAQGLSAGIEYAIQVAAKSAGGCGPFSEAIIFKTFGGGL